MLKNKEDKFNPIKSLTLYGYNEYFKKLIRLYENRNFPKVLLLTGEKGIGKFTLAFHIVNYFFSNNTANSYHLENLSINLVEIVLPDLLSKSKL